LTAKGAFSIGEEEESVLKQNSKISRIREGNLPDFNKSFDLGTGLENRSFAGVTRYGNNRIASFGES
jgi:hypothetical protein